MTERDRIDPESRGPLDELLQAIPGGFKANPDIVERRRVAREMRLADPARQPPSDQVTHADQLVPGPVGDPEVRVRVYHPACPSDPFSLARPGIFYIHGGGMIMGDLDGESDQAAMLCETLGAVVVSVDYRLAPEHPHPAPVEDCYAALAWMAAHSDELGFDRSRLAVYGRSAGGGLTIGTVLLCRDRGGPHVAFQMPIYPMIDDRNITPSSYEVTDLGAWDRAENIQAWAWYLADKPADQYAAPRRAMDLTGLPPTFIDVGELDLFRDENLIFATRLLQAGVPTEFHIYPGAYHASENLAPEAALSQRIWEVRLAALARAFDVAD
jgi:acetyl esterase/lipase